MAYASLLKPKAVLLDVQAADSEEMYGLLVDALAASDPDLADRKDEIREALRERESRGSTASQRVAIPHVKLPGLKKVSMAVAIHQGGIDFRALDGDSVHVFFSLVRPEESADEHLDILRWIAGIARHTDFVPFALQASNSKQFIELLTELAPA